MPAYWTNRQERQYGHILRSCRGRGGGVKRCKSLAAATVNKGLGVWGPAFVGLEAKLPGYRRRNFCLPGQTPSAGRYPVPDCSHAHNALARASAAFHEGYLTQSQYKKVRACANRAKRRLCR